MSIYANHIANITVAVKQESATLNKKCNDVTKINNVIAMGVATKVAFHVLEVPTDTGIMPRQYYFDNLGSIVDEVISGVNERYPLDYKVAIAMTWEVWYQRLLLVRGQVSEKIILDFLEDSPALTEQNRDVCDLRSELLYD